MDPKKKRIRSIKKLAESAEPLSPADHHPGTGRGNKYETRRPAGNSREYLMRRIKRDHPEVLQRCINGEFASVRQAAIAAGIIPPPPLVRIKQIGPSEWRIYRGHKLMGHIRHVNNVRFAVWLPDESEISVKHVDFGRFEDAKAWCEKNLKTDKPS